MAIIASIKNSKIVTKDGDNPVDVIELELATGDATGSQGFTADLYQQPNSESRPIDGDLAILVTDENGDRVCISTVDYNTPTNKKGEHTLKARDENGNIVASIKLNSEGKILINSGSDSLALTSKVDNFISKFDKMFRDWITVPNDGGAALKALFSAEFPQAFSSVDSETVKVDK